MKKIILDTNSLMAIAEFKVDLFSELERVCDFPFQMVVLQGTIDELYQIQKEQRGKYNRAARLALSILTAKQVPILPSQGNVDDLLAEYSRKGILVLTQDIGLKRRLTKPYLTIRQKKTILLVR